MANKLDARLAAHIAESGHWYDEQGSQIAAVEMRTKPGEFRDPSLADARKTGDKADKSTGLWCEGVTSIIAKGYRPQLEDWKIEQGIKAALRIDRERGADHSPHFEDLDYIKAIKATSKQLAKDAAEAGTAIHAAIQAHYCNEPIPAFYEEFVAAVQVCLDTTVGKVDWQAEKPVVNRLGYATKLDLVCSNWVIDTKTKDGDQAKLDKMRVYDGHFMQVAAGIAAEEGIVDGWPSETQHQGGVIYVSRDHPGAKSFKHIPDDKLAQGWDMFRALLAYSFAANRYKPSWAL